jgi:hypothetical protein
MRIDRQGKTTRPLALSKRKSPFYWRSQMMICDAMGSAESEYVIYFLLAAYLETTQFGSKLPECVTKLPLVGSSDVETRFQLTMALTMKSTLPSGHSNDKAGKVLGEALQIFGVALNRLNYLKRTRTPLSTLGSSGTSRFPPGSSKTWPLANRSFRADFLGTRMKAVGRTETVALRAETDPQTTFAVANLLNGRRHLL